MKKYSLLFLLVLLASVVSGSLFAQSILNTVWNIPATKNWFNSANTAVRGLGYNPNTNRLYVASRDVNTILILNAATGDSLGTLNMTGIAGGVYAFNRVSVASDGRIYTTNLVTAVTKAGPLKIYTWTTDASAPVLAYADSVLGPRLGDALTVVGSGANTFVYVAGNATPGAAHIFQRHASKADSLVLLKSVTPIGWATGVLHIGPLSANYGSNFWIKTNGKAAILYDTSGAPKDTIPTTVLTTSASSIGYFEFFGKKYLTAYGGNVSPHVARIVDINDGGLKSAAVGITPSMGTTTNSAGPTGEVIFSSADTSFYVLSTNNSIGKYSVTPSLASVTAGSRLPHVPDNNQADTVVVTIRSVKPVANAKLYYYGYKTSVSDQNGVDSANVALTLSSGNDVNGVYRAVIPASVNRDGRRINYKVEVNDVVATKTMSAILPGYYAGITKLAYQGGPREVDTNGVLLYKFYGIRSQGVVIVEDSIFQVTNNEIVVQDSLGGVTVFVAPAAFDVKRGNAYIITGTTDNPTGGGSKFQFVNPGVTFTDLGPAPKPIVPRVITIKQLLQNGELWENSLVEIRGVSKTPGSLTWPAATTSANMTFIDASGDSITMRIDSDTDIDGSPEPTYPITIVGVAGQFDNTSPFTSGYQWLPRDLKDIKPYSPPAPKFDDPQALNVKNVLSTIVLDGKLNEAEWNDAPTLLFGLGAEFRKQPGDLTATGGVDVKASFIVNGVTYRLPSKDSTWARVKFLHKGADLYIGVQSNDKSICKFDWEGDGLFIQIKDNAGVTKEYKLYYQNLNDTIRYEESVLNSGAGAGFLNSGSKVNDTTQVDSGYSAELRVKLTSLGYASTVNTVQLSMNVFNPNGYQHPMNAWDSTRGTYYKSWWGSEWGSAFRTLNLLPSYDNPDTVKPLLASSAITLDGKLNEPDWANAPTLIFGPPNAPKTGTEKTVTGSVDVKASFTVNNVVYNLPYKDTSFAKVKYLIKNQNLYIGIQSPDKSICKFDWEGDGIFVQIKDKTNATKEYKLYYQNIGTNKDTIRYEESVLNSGAGAGSLATGSTVNDTTNIDNGYTAELMIRLDKLGYTATASPVGIPVSMNIFDPDGYQHPMNAWDTARGTYFKSWWGSEWGSSMKTLLLPFLTGVSGEEQIPMQFALDQNFPNPFNPTTLIRFALPQNASTRLVIYDLLGREVRTLVNSELNAGYFETTWDGKNNVGSQVATGVYIYRIEAGSFISTKKMMLLK